MHLPLALAVATALCTGLYAQDLDLRVRSTTAGPLVTAVPDPEFRLKAMEIPNTLVEGLRSTISFQLRVYRPRRFWSFLGDHLVLERVIEREARWDSYTECFTVLHVNEAAECYDDAKEFLTAYLTLTDEQLALPPEDLPDGAYLRVRARLSPISIADNLRIIALFQPTARIATTWATLPLARVP